MTQLVPPILQNATGAAPREGIFSHILQTLDGRFFILSIITPLGAVSFHAIQGGGIHTCRGIQPVVQPKDQFIISKEEEFST